TRRLPPAVTARAERDFEARTNPDDRLLGDAIPALAAGCDGLLICSSEQMTAGMIERLPASVKMIATFSVGYEHIDVRAARARGITVSNTPDVLNDATADMAMLLLLAASRRAYEGNATVRQDRWGGWHALMLLGLQLTGKRLGIFGMGRIGQAVARRARGFGMSIHYHNRTRLPPEREAGAVYHADPQSLLAVSQFLSLHAPSTPDTRKFLDAERIRLLPDQAVVVNTGRGDLVDDEALIAALRSGKLFAAGLDVFAGEPKVHPGYRSLDNVFFMPHLGSATVETRDAMGFCALDNLDAFFAGRPVPNALT
ncbi:MAG TPA: D-glycerate dehydrogenase, partial [Candidatus Sulfotelmatobacter sp.]|nr:D-glycerate dehydrogenase [Candidatus Sulfotelmatobacter sp.]